MITTLLSGALLAQTTDGTVDAALGGSRVVYEFSRLRDFDNERLFVAAILAVAVGLFLLITYMYRRDAVELPKSVGVLLAVLRCVALGGLLLFFLGIERRTTREVVHPSQVAVLVDVSQSMGLTDSDAQQGGASSTRIDQVVDTLAHSPLIAELRRTHEVNVVRFDQDLQPVVTLPKLDKTADEDESATLDTTDDGVTAKPDGMADAASIDWSAELRPRGTETRLGGALAEQLRMYRDAPLAGLVVFSDGAQNAGIDPSAAAEAAKQAHVPIYTLGVGSTEPRRNVASPRPRGACPGLPARHDESDRLRASQRVGRPPGRRRADASAVGRTGRLGHGDRLAARDARPRRRSDARHLRLRANRAGQLPVPHASGRP